MGHGTLTLTLATASNPHRGPSGMGGASRLRAMGHAVGAGVKDNLTAVALRSAITDVLRSKIKLVLGEILMKSTNEKLYTIDFFVKAFSVARDTELVKGHIFNVEAGKHALRNINSLALFSNIEVNPRADEKIEGGIIVEIKLKELEQKSAEVSTEWSLVPGRNGWPALASIQPGGITFEHRNIKGLNRSIVGSVTSSNLLILRCCLNGGHLCRSIDVVVIWRRRYSEKSSTPHIQEKFTDSIYFADDFYSKLW